MLFSNACHLDAGMKEMDSWAHLEFGFLIGVMEDSGVQGVCKEVFEMREHDIDIGRSPK